VTQGTRTHAYVPNYGATRRRTGDSQAIQWELAWEYGWSVDQPPGAPAVAGDDKRRNASVALDMALALAG
jgi:hypothetical protein